MEMSLFFSTTLALLILIGAFIVYVIKDAKKYGQNPWLWVLIALACVPPIPIGVLMYFALKPTWKKLLLLPYCLNCGTPKSKGVDFCVECGKALGHHLKA
ncbi:MAG: hypothetical protein ACXAEL_08245 [Candidatus Hodarchaeales archaeon]|jgi:hypothetical protein